MRTVFTALAIPCDSREPVEIGHGESYGEAERTIWRYADLDTGRRIAYYRIEERFYDNGASVGRITWRG